MKYEKQITTVNWLENKLAENLKHIVLNRDYEMMENIFKEAYSKEKEQIINAWEEGNTDFVIKYESGLEYFNEFYKPNDTEIDKK
jgi:hypothetical protein